MAGLSGAALAELGTYKRPAELQRVLLPDAPPRKRATRKPSPEREDCQFAPEERAGSGVPSGVHVPEGLEDETDSSWESIGVHVPEVVMDQSGTSGEPIGIPNVEIEIIDQFQTYDSGVLADKFEDTTDDWLRQIDDSDDDINNDNDDCSMTLVSTLRNVAIEPATDSDLTAFEARVMSVEDANNDAAIRKMAPVDSFVFKWTKNVDTFTGQRETFTGPTPGPTFSFTTILDVFKEMIDTDFIDGLCTETNRYAKNKIVTLTRLGKLTENSRLRRWTNTNRNEMYTYLAVTLLQGLYPNPEEEAYFSYNGFGTMPWFAKIMSYNRYLLLKSLLHFVDNNKAYTTDRLYKIEPVITYFNKKFSTLYNLSQNVVIDESLLKWHGRLSFSQKIASKAAQVGVKTYELCESSTGYLWKFFVYAGKQNKTGRADATTDETREPTTEETTEPTEETTGPTEETTEPTEEPTDPRTDAAIDDVRPDNLTAKIVYDLAEPVLNKGHTLIMDNFYNSPLLARCLKRQKTDVYGTLRLHREFVPSSLKSLTKTDLRQGEVVASYCPDVSIMVWRDANLVSLISTYHNLQIGTSQKYNKVTYKPSIVLDYNKTMGGVDRKDQYLAAQPVERVRNHIWYKKLFRRLFNTAVFNCFVIYTHTDHHKISHRQFRRVLAEGLIKVHRQLDPTTGTRLLVVKSPMTRRRDLTRPVVEHDHFPVKTGTNRSRCWICSRQRKSTRTSWKCIECNINLCIDKCFRAYHKP